MNDYVTNSQNDLTQKLHTLENIMLQQDIEKLYDKISTLTNNIQLLEKLIKGNMDIKCLNCKGEHVVSDPMFIGENDE